MKQRRRMLLCVTATSMAAAVVMGCAKERVGMGEAQHPDTEATSSPDAAAENAAPHPVGTTAQVPDAK